jgi:anti-sigma regulatory factor (Ser/Thr protein kinase)
MSAGHSPFSRFHGRNGNGNAPGWSRIDLGGHEVVSRLHMRMRAGPQAAGEGRHALDRLEGAIKSDQLSELRLLVTELLTNSIRHGAGPDDWILLDVEIYANAVRAVVTDRGPGFLPEAEPQPDVDRPGGWGLCLVDRLADRWGVNTGERTEVWFEFDRSPFAATA